MDFLDKQVEVVTGSAGSITQWVEICLQDDSNYPLLYVVRCKLVSRFLVNDVPLYIASG